MDDFYLVLLSNTTSHSSTFYDNLNTVSEFTTQLPHNIELGYDKWECALCSISYLHSWYNIDEDSHIYVDLLESVESNTAASDDEIQRIKKKILIPKGHYNDDGLSFASMLTEKLQNAGSKSEFPHLPKIIGTVNSRKNYVCTKSLTFFTLQNIVEVVCVCLFLFYQHKKQY